MQLLFKQSAMVYTRYSLKKISVSFDLRTNRDSKSRRDGNYMIFAEDDHYNSYNSFNFFQQRIPSGEQILHMKSRPALLEVLTPLFISSHPNISVGKCNTRGVNVHCAVV
ncbi:hypothetical protein MRB53_019588 [Persea americana]|uniref:Uncharacterized protein n=1 Tax=Persea americana TaxID=3435 RepID=A0ACC2KYQ7_PERAE|nr:hypothetical protein MRB53_019588 [Persea americana]